MILSLLEERNNTTIYKVYDIKTEKFYKLDIITRT